MKKQNVDNHIRFYKPHHFVFYPLTLSLLIIAIYFAFSSNENIVWTFIATSIFLVIWVSYMLRQHYALTLQDRLIFLEIRYRYFVITGNRFEKFEEKLNKSQIFALRFAHDEELVSLTNRAISENLSASAIKKSIQKWKPDHQRV
ncbi:hypothetical protein GV828_12525 [Flavobacterium sp. NST-5]|uniref:ABC transporter permease n=1 Tax=Flavobacterium ichthyis TaxID=2698827 RepID=A0ABW9ZAT5_9FLAO|nr:DUF6526 family protein [Flavobacterium ichthyis]NBL66025.1 hypothetical protein [Flavobacterium ichthyis]